MNYLILFLLLVISPGVAGAQTSDSGGFDELPIPSWGKEILDAFNKPLHPVLGGVASGGGPGFGVGYDSPDADLWYRDAEAMVTVRRYWSLEGEIGRRWPSKRSQIGAFGGVRHMNRLDFFGIGPTSNRADRSAFRLRETTFGTRGWWRAAPAVRLGGAAAFYQPDLGPGAAPSVRSIEQVLSPATVPGFAAEPTFTRYRGFIELLHPRLNNPDSPDEEVDALGGAYQLAVELVRDHDGGRHNFHRWEAELQQRVRGFRPGQRLTLHGFLATTGSDSEVPFYMLYTLGGSGGLKSFRPDLLGTDGSRASLRAFRNYRFRDRDLLLMQAEYRIPIVDRLQATVFVDAGQVAPRVSRLFRDLHTGTGFSLGYVRDGKTVARVDVGLGGEGVEVFWTFGGF